MWHVIGITEHQLKGMRTGRKFNCGFGLALAKMPVVVAAGYRQAEVFELCIDQQVVMTAGCGGIARRGYGHAADAKLDGHR